MSNITGFDTKDLDRLIYALEDLGTVGKKISKEGIIEAADIVLKQQQSDAPKAKSGSTKGYSHLAIDKKIKTYRSGNCYAKIGITSDNWENAKGLYFQHMGYSNKGRGNRYKGMYISKHAGWMNKSFDSCKEKARLKLYTNISKKLKLKL